MKILDLYTPFIKKLTKSKKSVEEIVDEDELLHPLKEFVQYRQTDLRNVNRWMRSPEYKDHRQMATSFVKSAPKLVKHIETFFGNQGLTGELKLAPSFMSFDGFARYDSGAHTVWFGVDHPDADEKYLKGLLAHELSHVYRDHQPTVWGFLKKPLIEVSRQEYLDNTTAYEHLASEGLATLFSQVVYPDIPIHIHHFYFENEMKWCLENTSLIEDALKNCLKSDQEVWDFYYPDKVVVGSPSRVQYFWAAKKISNWLEKQNSQDLGRAIVEAHRLPATDFIPIFD